MTQRPRMPTPQVGRTHSVHPPPVERGGQAPPRTMTDPDIGQVADPAELGDPPDQVDVLADLHRLVETTDPAEGVGVDQQGGTRHVRHRLADADVGRCATQIERADPFLEPGGGPGARQRVDPRRGQHHPLGRRGGRPQVPHHGAEPVLVGQACLRPGTRSTVSGPGRRRRSGPRPAPGSGCAAGLAGSPARSARPASGSADPSSTMITGRSAGSSRSNSRSGPGAERAGITRVMPRWSAAGGAGARSSPAASSRSSSSATAGCRVVSAPPFRPAGPWTMPAPRLGQRHHPVGRAAGKRRVIKPLHAGPQPPAGVLHRRCLLGRRLLGRSLGTHPTNPPSTLMAAPVTAVAPGPHSQLTAAAISAGSTSRPSLWCGAKSSASAQAVDLCAALQQRGPGAAGEYRVRRHTGRPEVGRQRPDVAQRSMFRRHVPGQAGQSGLAGGRDNGHEPAGPAGPEAAAERRHGPGSPRRGN